MILEQGRIIEFDRYMQSFFLDDDKKTNYPLSCAQACHLVEKLNLWILFVMQSNGKRRICNVERNGRSLDSEASPSPFIHIPYVPLPLFWEYPIIFSRFTTAAAEVYFIKARLHKKGVFYIKRSRFPIQTLT